MKEKTVGPNRSWRMVYSNGEIMMLEELTGYTTTIHELFEAQTKQECEAKAQELGLVMPIVFDENI